MGWLLIGAALLLAFAAPAAVLAKLVVYVASRTIYAKRRKRP